MQKSLIVEEWLEQTERGRFRNWLMVIDRNVALNLLNCKPKGGIGIGGPEGHDMLGRLKAEEHVCDDARWQFVRPGFNGEVGTFLCASYCLALSIQQQEIGAGVTYLGTRAAAYRAKIMVELPFMPGRL